MKEFEVELEFDPEVATGLNVVAAENQFYKSRDRLYNLLTLVLVRNEDDSIDEYLRVILEHTTEVMHDFRVFQEAVLASEELTEDEQIAIFASVLYEDARNRELLLQYISEDDVDPELEGTYTLADTKASVEDEINADPEEEIECTGLIARLCGTFATRHNRDLKIHCA